MSDGLDPILQQKEQQQLKTQLLWRLGIAAALIGIVLAAIAWFDQERKNAVPEVKIASDVETAKILTPLVAASEIESATPNPNISSEVASAPTLSPSPSPSPSPSSSLSHNQTPIQAISNPAPKPSTTTPRAVVAEQTRSAPKPDPLPIPLMNAPTPMAARQPVKPSNNYPAATTGQQGYSVQAGVFLHANNAEKLLVQLQTAGIPAYLETRVQIGPFKSKSQADIAVKKLRQLGIEPVLRTQ
ncbi:SPOR domain-containing protein [Deefgea piscis]|uniref:SPOR domain-containing protein n=1 Tax=Deefgea piscis TaxID=2739061 RepID=A0A6M8SJW9_9NEIS|nr:SPOR domain-containing protein [Deefgea piscis]QKJ65355.1 SPOR domain-containing protein [Deefgea piscis]